MCGRYCLISSAELVAELFGLAGVPALPLRFNIAPTQACPIVHVDDTDVGRTITPMRWGLVPSWAKDASIGNRMINARAETAAEKPAYRAALRRRRCLVPADGFYEWQKRAGERTKQPHCIRMKDDRPFAFAGLWESWNDPGGAAIKSFTILTTRPNAVLEPVHDRMPVIIARNDFERWLDPAVQDGAAVADLLVPFPAEAMRAFPVSGHVNRPANDDPRCMQPFAAEEGLWELRADGDEDA